MSRTSYRSAALFLTLALLGGCGKGGSGRLVGPHLPGDPADLVSWVTATPQAFRAGETVQIEVGLRNPTDHPIVAHFNECFWFAVTDANGTVVTPSLLCDAVPTYVLAPGEAIVTKSSWDGTARAPLPPGAYRVHAVGFTVPDTAPVTIEILAP